jgi:excinuclease ABC subunit C
MNFSDVKKKKLPDTPGVYFFLGPRKNTRANEREILYIGKATSLRDRVRSYFSPDLVDMRSPLIEAMVAQAEDVDYKQTDSVLEALVLEARLIKKHQPKHNTDLKDDKSFNFVIITNEAYPRVLIARERDIVKKKIKHKPKDIFGPFPHGGQLKEGLKILRTIFPFRDTCEPDTGKPCFNRQIKLCPGVCTGEVTEAEYKKQIRNIKMFFEGKKGNLVKTLIKEMMAAAKKLEFEKAQQIKNTLFALEHIRDVALIKDESFKTPGGLRIEAYDIAHTSGKDMVGVMTVVEAGEIQKSEYRKFNIKSFEGVNDTRALREVLERRLEHHDWELPKIIVVDGGKAQKNVMEKVLSHVGVSIPVMSVVKDERHRPKDILGDKKIKETYEKQIILANAESHRFALSFHRKSRGRMPK